MIREELGERKPSKISLASAFLGWVAAFATVMTVAVWGGELRGKVNDNSSEVKELRIKVDAAVIHLAKLDAKIEVIGANGK